MFNHHNDIWRRGIHLGCALKRALPDRDTAFMYLESGHTAESTGFDGDGYTVTINDKAMQRAAAWRSGSV